MNRKLITILAVVLVVGAGAAYGIFALQSTGSPPPASLSPTDDEPDPTVTVNTDDIEGEWTVAPGDSFVGYRVREKLAFLPAPNDAVGRTSTIEGTMTVSGTRSRAAPSPPTSAISRATSPGVTPRSARPDSSRTISPRRPSS